MDLPPSAVTDALRTQNRDASGGRIAEGKRDIRIRSIGRFSRLDEIENTLLSAAGQTPVLVKDVATVEMGYKEVDRIVRNKGRTVIALNAQREVGSNVVEVMAGFQARLKMVQADMLPAEARRLGIDGTFNLEQVYDQTLYIHQAVDLVTQNLWVGGRPRDRRAAAVPAEPALDGDHRARDPDQRHRHVPRHGRHRAIA